MRSGKLLLILTVLLGGQAAWANTAATFSFSVDTSSIASSLGALEFELFSGAPQSITAAVQGFQPIGGVDTSTLFVLGDNSGDLSSILLLDNACCADNFYSPNFTYGPSINFQVTLSWSAPVDPSNPSAFHFYMFDSSNNPVLAAAGPNNPGGWAGELDVPTTAGPLAFTSFSEQLTITQASAIPEPATLVFAISGLLAIGACRRRRR